MSEVDSLSDSDWLDISSGRDSDDNDSLSSQDSDHEEISSLPLSRRSSISNGSSMNSEVEAWEGFVSDNGDEVAPDPHAEAVLGFIPDINDHSTVAPEEVDEEDRKVRDALDQSFVGTLSASRSSTTGGHTSSTHTSLHDLRLSFPDPLTSSHDELNTSYHAISSTETSAGTSTDNDDAQEPTTVSMASSCLSEDPGIITTTSEVRCPEGQQQHLIESEEKSELEIVLYGASSEIKLQFIQELVQKAAENSGRVLVNPLQSGVESEQIQTMRLHKDSEALEIPFFNVVTVRDRTGDRLPPKLELDTLSGDPDHLSLAVVYLPTPKLPILPLHTSFLPVLVSSSSILTADFDNAIALQAAEDDWDLLCVPADKTLNIGRTRSPVFDSNKLLHITSEQAYGIFQDVGRETKKVTLKPVTEQIKSVNAVTLFALMSIIMGFAFNTAFRPSTPAPTPTVNTPSSSNGLWGMFVPLPNRSMVPPSTSAVPLKEMALSILNPGMTALSVTSPPTSMALSIASSSSKAVSEITNITPNPSISYTKCIQCKFASDKPRASTDMDILSESPTALSEVHMKPSVSIVSRTDGGSSGSNTILFGDQTASSSGSSSSSSGNPKATANPKVISSVSDVLDATSKALENIGNDIVYLTEAADELMTSLRMQRDNIITQSKGKARALSEQLQNLNEEMIYRNERAKSRARELKKHGEELLWNTQERLKKRTERARTKAKELGKSVLESEAWATYQKVQKEVENHLGGDVRENGGEDGGNNRQRVKQRKNKKDKGNFKVYRKGSPRLSRHKRKSH